MYINIYNNANDYSNEKAAAAWYYVFANIIMTGPSSEYEASVYYSSWQI